MRVFRYYARQGDAPKINGCGTLPLACVCVCVEVLHMQKGCAKVERTRTFLGLA